MSCNCLRSYVGNMAPDVDEKVLIKEFGRFGAIGSVKVGARRSWVQTRLQSQLTGRKGWRGMVQGYRLSHGGRTLVRMCGIPQVMWSQAMWPNLSLYCCTWPLVPQVMWPRDEEQRRKGRNCGFVAFMVGALRPPHRCTSAHTCTS